MPDDLTKRDIVVTTHLPVKIKQRIDEIVREGMYMTVAEFVREAIRRFIDDIPDWPLDAKEIEILDFAIGALEDQANEAKRHGYIQLASYLMDTACRLAGLKRLGRGEK